MSGDGIADAELRCSLVVPLSTCRGKGPQCHVEGIEQVAGLSDARLSAFVRNPLNYVHVQVRHSDPGGQVVRSQSCGTEKGPVGATRHADVNILSMFCATTATATAATTSLACFACLTYVKRGYGASLYPLL